jgi:CheY-like chemotaxis protein
MEFQSTKSVLLYAEDDLDDFDALKSALGQITTEYELVHANNGTEVISYLEKNKQLPYVIVLDLNMPVMDGKDTLEWIKGNENYKDIPTMVFTTSSRDEDIKFCQAHGCTFFRKPTLYRDLLHIVQMMLQMGDRHASANS